MSKSARLRLADLRAIRDLTNECRDLGDDADAWHTHYFQRLAHLCRADLVIGGPVAVGESGGIQAVHPIEWGWENGFDRAGFTRVMAEFKGDLVISPAIDAYFRRPGGADGTGASRTDLVADRDWYTTSYFQVVQRAIGVDHALLSFLALPGRAGEVNCINLCRPIGVRRDFGPRDRELLREAHVWVVPLIGGPLARFDEPSPAELSPRVRQVLRCFLEGDSDKQVTLRLGVTRHTVNEYAKTIYRHFGVSSRGELLTRWARRGWGTKCAWAEER